MGWIRLHLRMVAVVWLVGQAVAVSAVSLGDCCAGHRVPVVNAKSAAKAKACHGAEAPAAPACPMRALDGSACRMHRAHSEHPQQDQAACTLKSTCAGPVAALASVLFVQGVLPRPISVPVRLDTPERVAIVVDAPLTFVIRPESPPPRPSTIA
jgi:hypothetical protein